MGKMNRDPEIEKFYTGRTWRACRAKFAESKGGLCERCLAKGIINAGSKERPLECHHKIPLTAQNVHDPAVALNWDNLELLCKSCHDDQKRKESGKRWIVGADGTVLAAG